jgi:hypothetical protein
MPLQPKGKVYEINGEEIILYPIARLVEELSNRGFPRDAQTIRKWEGNVTPPATFRVGKKRLYAWEQIQAYCDVAEECNIRQGYSIAMTDFSERIWERLQEVNEELGITN